MDSLMMSIENARKKKGLCKCSLLTEVLREYCMFRNLSELKRILKEKYGGDNEDAIKKFVLDNFKSIKNFWFVYEGRIYDFPETFIKDVPVREVKRLGKYTLGLMGAEFILNEWYKVVDWELYVDGYFVVLKIKKNIFKKGVDIEMFRNMMRLEKLDEKIKGQIAALEFLTK